MIFGHPRDPNLWNTKKWIDDASGFPKSERASLILIIHRDGKNIFGDDGSLAIESTERMFEALDHFRATERYEELCSYSDYINPATNETTCQIVGVSTFWNESTAIFKAQSLSDDDVLGAMSAEIYPTGGNVDHDQIIGYNKFDENGILNYGETFVVVILLPPDEDDSEAFSEDFEEDARDRMLALQDKWNAEAGNDFKVEIIAERSFDDEFTRAVTKGTCHVLSLFLQPVPPYTTSLIHFVVQIYHSFR